MTSTVYDASIAGSSFGSMLDIYTASLGMRKLGYLQVSSIEFLNEISTIQPRTMVWNNTVSSPESRLASHKILKKAEKLITSYHVIVTIQVFLASCTFHMKIRIISISICQELQVFCYPTSVNTKRKN